MQQLDVVSDEAWKQFLPGAQQEDDKNLIVSFFIDKKLMGAKSEAAGKPIYEDREYVKIMIKGQDKQIVIEEVRPHHKQKYPIAYMLFQQNKPAPVIGTPIEMLPGVGPSMAHHLKGMHIRTVEDVANVTDENTLQAIGAGARDLVRRAKAWLEQTNEKSLNLQAQLAEKDREAAALKAQIEAFEARFAALEAATPVARAPTKRRRQEQAAS